MLFLDDTVSIFTYGDMNMHVCHLVL